MRAQANKNREGLFKSIALAYMILILHVVLLAGLGLLVFFFGGLVRHVFWIVLIGMMGISLSFYLFYRRLRREGRSLREALRAPLFQGRAMEISFLGGMASFRLGPPSRPNQLDDGGREDFLKLEDPETACIRDIATLAELLEKDLITPEEFAAAKQKVLGFGLQWKSDQKRGNS